MHSGIIKYADTFVWPFPPLHGIYFAPIQFFTLLFEAFAGTDVLFRLYR